MSDKFEKTAFFSRLGYSTLIRHRKRSSKCGGKHFRLKTEHFGNNAVPGCVFLKQIQNERRSIVTFSNFFGAEWPIDISQSQWLLSSKLFQKESHWAFLEQTYIPFNSILSQKNSQSKFLIDPLEIIYRKKWEKERLNHLRWSLVLAR